MWATEWFLKWEIKTLVDKLRDKEEEIKKLKSDLSLVIKERDDNIEQNKKMKEERDNYMMKYAEAMKEKVLEWNKLATERNKWRWKYNRLKSEFNILQDKNIKLKEENSYRNKIVDIIPQDEKSVAEETIQDLLKENQKLNKRIKELELCNLNLQTWIDNKEKVNKSLREENKRLSDFLECEA